MRVGNNPNRHKQVKGYGSAVVSAITYLPNQAGYHEHRFEVIKASLLTMRMKPGMECETMIWDNGSCDTLKEWMFYEYKPDHLILSHNVGKATARAGIIRMLPGSVIVGIADDDMYYYPNWLHAQVALLEHFPDVGQVSGYPVRTQFRWGNKKTLEWAKRWAEVRVGKFIPTQWDMDFCVSIGRDYNYQVITTVEDAETIVTYNNMSAYAVAHHCQFICIAGRLAPIVRYDHDAMGDEKPFDNAVDAAGLLRLTTLDRYTRHIGNILDPELQPPGGEA